MALLFTSSASRSSPGRLKTRPLSTGMRSMVRVSRVGERTSTATVIEADGGACGQTLSLPIARRWGAVAVRPASTYSKRVQWHLCWRLVMPPLPRRPHFSNFLPQMSANRCQIPCTCVSPWRAPGKRKCPRVPAWPVGRRPASLSVRTLRIDSPPPTSITQQVILHCYRICPRAFVASGRVSSRDHMWYIQSGARTIEV